MPVAAAPRLYTLDDYLKTPESLAPTQLAFGVMMVRDAPLPRHQEAVAQLFRALDAHVRARRLGRMWLAPLDVILDPDAPLVVQPDLFFVSNDRASIVGDRVRGAPDLVIEVLSPEPRVGRLDERVRWFAEYGVAEAWLVHQDRRSVAVVPFTDRRVKRRRLFAESEPIASVVLPDFHMTLLEILQE